MLNSDIRQAEYESLRSEILASLRQQFEVMVLTATLGIAIFGYAFSVTNEIQRGTLFLCVYILLLHEIL